LIRTTPRVVIDTNTFISAAILLHSSPARAVQAAIASSVLLTSEATWQELRDVLLRPKFNKYRAHDVRAKLLLSWQAYFEPIEVTTSLAVCRHSKDDKFLELAVDGRADFLISGDQDLLTLHPFRSIEIITPAAYLDRFHR
jgi:uncharacterized protein